MATTNTNVLQHTSVSWDDILFMSHAVISELLKIGFNSPKDVQKSTAPCGSLVAAGSTSDALVVAPKRSGRKACFILPALLLANRLCSEHTKGTNNQNTIALLCPSIVTLETIAVELRKLTPAVFKGTPPFQISTLAQTQQELKHQADELLKTRDAQEKIGTSQPRCNFIIGTLEQFRDFNKLVSVLNWCRFIVLYEATEISEQKEDCSAYISAKPENCSLWLVGDRDTPVLQRVAASLLKPSLTKVVVQPVLVPSLDKFGDTCNASGLTLSQNMARECREIGCKWVTDNLGKNDSIFKSAPPELQVLPVLHSKLTTPACSTTRSSPCDSKYDLCS